MNDQFQRECIDRLARIEEKLTSHLDAHKRFWVIMGTIVTAASIAVNLIVKAV